MSVICVTFSSRVTVVAAEAEPVNEIIISAKPDGATDSSQETLREDDSQPFPAAYVHAPIFAILT